MVSTPKRDSDRQLAGIELIHTFKCMCCPGAHSFLSLKVPVSLCFPADVNAYSEKPLLISLSLHKKRRKGAIYLHVIFEINGRALTITCNQS